jgi:hypothetical protein
MKRMALVVLCLAASAPAAAIVPALCDSGDPQFVGWDNSRAFKGPALKIADSVTVTLEPTPGYSLAKMVTPNSAVMTYQGVATLRIEKGGRISIALGSKARIDLLKRGIVLTSVGHRHSTSTCPNIAKIVSFMVKRGVYTLRLTDAMSEEVHIMAVDG